MTERMFLDRLLSRFAAASIDLQAAVGGRYGPIAIEDAEERYSVARQRIIDAVRDYGRRCVEKYSECKGERALQVAEALMAEEGSES